MTRVLILISALLFVICVGLAYQVQRRNQTIDDIQETIAELEVAVADTKASSDAAKKILEDAIRSGQENAPDTANALKAIARTEAKVDQLLAKS